MKITGGYYIKARKIQDSSIATAPPHVREIWDWLLKEVNHSDKVYNGRNIKRGQCVRSYSDIINGLKWYVGYRKMTYSKANCETAMKWLKKHTMITTTKTTKGMVITICNYDKYQDPKNYETYKKTTKKPTRKPQSVDTINKNEKNVINNISPKWFSGNLKQKIFDFVLNRKSNNSAMTENAIKLFIGKVEKYSGGNIEIAISMIDNAIINNWKSVYKPKNTQQGNFDFLEEL